MARYAPMEAMVARNKRCFRMHAALLRFAAQDALKKTGLPETVRAAERQREQPEAVANRVARLELVGEWA